jgi:hypothetical protein
MRAWERRRRRERGQLPLEARSAFFWLGHPREAGEATVLGVASACISPRPPYIRAALDLPLLLSARLPAAHPSRRCIS